MADPEPNEVTPEVKPEPPKKVPTSPTGPINAPGSQGVPESGLENAVNSSDSMSFEQKARKVMNKVFLGGLTTALSVGTMGASSLWIPGFFAGGGFMGKLLRGKTKLYDNLVSALNTYAALNTVLYPMVTLGNWMYPLIPTAVGKGVASITAHNAAFTGSFLTVNHLYENDFNPSGLTNTYKEHFVPNWKRFFWIFAPAYIAAANGVPEVAVPYAESFKYIPKKLPTFAANALPAALYGGLVPPKTTSERKARKAEKQARLEALRNPQTEQPEGGPGGPQQDQYRLPQVDPRMMDQYKRAA